MNKPVGWFLLFLTSIHLFGNGWSFEPCPKPPTGTVSDTNRTGQSLMFPKEGSNAQTYAFRVLLEPNRPKALDLFKDRFSFRYTNRMNSVRILERLRDETASEWIDEFAAKDMRNALGSGARLALRQYALQETLAVPAVLQRLETFQEFILETFGGRPETGQLQSPLNRNEGVFIPTEERKPSGVRFFFRPISENNPYAGIGYGKRDGEADNLYTINLRYYYRQWEHHTAEAIGELRLLHGWFLFGGVRGNTKELLLADKTTRNDHDLVLGAVGVRGRIRKVDIYVNGDVYPRQEFFVVVSIPR